LEVSLEIGPEEIERERGYMGMRLTNCTVFADEK